MMMSNHDRRFLNMGPPNKRKTLDGLKPNPPFNNKKPNTVRPGPIAPARKTPPDPAHNNQLLAGFLAHEFLTKGTLFGEPWDPARAEAVPVSADSRREEKRARREEKAAVRAGPSEERKEMYTAVAGLMKTDGAHLPGVVNPTQLARFLRL